MVTPGPGRPAAPIVTLPALFGRIERSRVVSGVKYWWFELRLNLMIQEPVLCHLQTRRCFQYYRQWRSKRNIRRFKETAQWQIFSTSNSSPCHLERWLGHHEHHATDGGGPERQRPWVENLSSSCCEQRFNSCSKAPAWIQGDFIFLSGHLEQM